MLCRLANQVGYFFRSRFGTRYTVVASILVPQGRGDPRCRGEGMHEGSDREGEGGGRSEWGWRTESAVFSASRKVALGGGRSG